MEAAAPWEMADDGKGYAAVWALTPNLEPSRGMPAEVSQFHITISTVNGRSGASPEEISAIAREIKALPAMLAALEAVANYIEDMSYGDGVLPRKKDDFGKSIAPTYRQISAALALARGEVVRP